MLTLLRDLVLKLLTSDPALTAIGTGAGFLLLMLLKHFKAQSREALVEKAAEVAYTIAFEVSKATANTWDDKVAEALKAFRDYLATHGAEPTDAELERAKLTFQHLSGAA